jgi:hypothetical protein
VSRLTASSGDHAIEARVEDRVRTFRVLRGGAPLSWSAVPRALSEAADVRAVLTRTLQNSPHEAFFWECRPWRGGDPTFEFVLVPTARFSPMTASPRAFAARFDDALVASFDSLGGDARLLAPRPLGRPDDALHLARFVRRAPPAQVEALWIAVGDELAAWRRADRGPLWLSTSGLGVPWLHVRIDSRPKYYTHAVYR